MKTIICIGTSRLYAEGAAALVESNSHGRVRAFASSTDEWSRNPADADVLVVDLPARNGADFVRTVHASTPELPVIAVVDPARKEDVLGYARVGVARFFAIDRSAAELVASIIEMDDKQCRSLNIAASIDHAHHHHHREERHAAELTPRQHEVLALIERGLSNKEIARELRVELPTVKNHVHQILSKTRMRRRTQAVHMLRGFMDSHRSERDAGD